MLYGALIGLIIGLIVGIYRAFFVKGDPCPKCGQPLPVPWFTPLPQCPACGGSVIAQAAPTQAAQTSPSWRAWWPVFVPVLLAVCGMALIVLFLPGALESRRLWLYQQERVEKAPQEIEDLKASNDPAAPKRIQLLESLLRPGGWNPQGYHRQYQRRMLGACLGGFLLVAAIALPLLRRRMRMTQATTPA